MENDKLTLAAFVCKKTADDALSATLYGSELLFAAIREGDRQTEDAITRKLKDVRERAANLYSSTTIMVDHPEREDAEQNAFFLVNRTIEAIRGMMQTAMNSPQRELRKRNGELVKRIQDVYASVSIVPKTLDDIAFNTWDGSYANIVRKCFESLNEDSEEV